MGLGDINQVDKPTLIPQLSGIDICMICAGETHMAALTKRGEIYLWGDNSDNILGLGVDTNTSYPKKLLLPGIFLTDV